jgi:hypothetical protein
MLSLNFKKDKLRVTDNLLPQNNKTMATRPSAEQIVDGVIEHATQWGNRILFVKDGRIQLWDQNVYDIAPAGRSLDASAYQALTQDALREDRLYVADGLNPLWYVVREFDTYNQKTITNNITDEANIPYPLTTAESVTTWRNRLFTTDGNNRVYHCDNEKPHDWDPLFTLEFQSGLRAPIKAVEAMAGLLVIGTHHSLFSVTGDSQYNWHRDFLVKEHGAVSPSAIATDGTRLYYLSTTGLRKLGVDKPLSDDDLADAFITPDYSAKLVLSPDGKYLLFLVNGRLFVMNTYTEQFGEITQSARGVFSTSDQAGWYGDDGIWIMTSHDAPDIWLDGREADVVSIYEIWPDFPNPQGRALNTRGVFHLKGTDRSNATYTVTATDENEKITYSEEISIADETTDWLDVWDGTIRDWPGEPVQREVKPMIAGTKFSHKLESRGHLEIVQFEPQYRYGGDE